MRGRRQAVFCYGSDRSYRTLERLLASIPTAASVSLMLAAFDFLGSLKLEFGTTWEEGGRKQCPRPRKEPRPGRVKKSG